MFFSDPNIRTRQDAKERGYAVDDTIYPWVAYKGPRFNPETWCHVLTDYEANLEAMIRWADKLCYAAELLSGHGRTADRTAGGWSRLHSYIDGYRQVRKEDGPSSEQ